MNGRRSWKRIFSEESIKKMRTFSEFWNQYLNYLNRSPWRPKWIWINYDIEELKKLMSDDEENV